MTGLISSLIPRAIRWLSNRVTLLGFCWRRLWFDFSHPNITVSAGVNIARTVHLQATDGGEIILHPGCQLSRGVSIVTRGGRVELGRNTFVGPWSSIVSIEGVNVGSDCLIAERVTLRDQNHCISGEPGVAIRESGFDTAPIRIGDDVWVGAGAAILKGVDVGSGSVVGANAVLNRDVGAGMIVGGVPARILGDRSSSMERS